jgi:HlyD family secretion protein
MQKKLIFTALGLLAVALLIWALRPAPMDVETALVTRGRFERLVQEDGKTRLRNRYLVSTPLAGHVARITLKQGDAVRKDEVVATLWPVAPALLDERARAEQQARIGGMQAALARAQVNVDRASVALAQAQTELARNDALAKQGFVSANQNETARLAMRLRDRELASARQDELAARFELDQSRVALRQFARPGQGEQPRVYQVTAPVRGRVLKLIQPNEGLLPAGTALMELGTPGELEVEVDILTEDAAQIQPGTPVRMTNWGGSTDLAGRVRLVEPAAFTKVSALGVQEQRVNTIIDISSAPETWAALGDGFKVDVQVLVQVVEDAVLVPVSALFPMGSRSALFAVAQGRAKLQELEVAARNGSHAWVKTGLMPGTQVIVYPDTQLKDGDRVRSR